MYGKIISFLFVLLILYYVVLILLDLQRAKAAIAAELEKNCEEEIDISDEAKTFKPVLITREEPKKLQITEEEIEDNKAGESTEQSVSKDYHQLEKNESIKDNNGCSVDKPTPENINSTIMPVNPFASDTPIKKSESEKKDKDNPNLFKREGYREPTMTNGVPIEEIIEQVDEYAETGKGPLGEVIFECRSAQF